MSKKKNTLKDLDEFLKQQAAIIVSPAALTDKIESASVEIHPSTPTSVTDEVSAEKIILELTDLSRKEGITFRKKLYDIIIRSLETNPVTTPEDKMLINTALYLKAGDNWKEVIREYWRGKASSTASSKEEEIR